MKLSIIIVSWNTRDLLIECLQSVYSSTREVIDAGHVETFVVDNASTDGSVEAVQQSFPWVIIMENPGNVGFASANNQAIRASCGEYVLLLNPDTHVLGEALVTLVHFLDNHLDVGAVGARLLNDDGSLQQSCYPAPTLPGELARMFHIDALVPFGVYWMERWPVTQPRDVDVIQGACLMLRRKVLDAVGLLDEGYFMYSEEVDLCTRVRRGGWRLFWVPSAQVIHYGGQSSKQAATPMFVQLYASKILYFRTYYGAVTTILYKLILAAATLVRLALSPLALFEKREARAKHLTLANRYGHLLRTLPKL